MTEELHRLQAAEARHVGLDVLRATLETNAAGTAVAQVVADVAGEQDTCRGDIAVV